jgi:hypothetical protein
MEILKLNEGFYKLKFIRNPYGKDIVTVKECYGDSIVYRNYSYVLYNEKIYILRYGAIIKNGLSKYGYNLEIKMTYSDIDNHIDNDCPLCKLKNIQKEKYLTTLVIGSFYDNRTNDTFIDRNYIEEITKK